ncbi:MAG: hypothetical protein ACRELB_07045 [Polyangiaceae bacterium]
MSDAAKPPEGTPAPLSSADDVKASWDRFRGGAAVVCPGDGGPMALSVDAGLGIYRLVCTSCGLASPWFESGPGGVRLRGQSQPSVPARGGTVEE